MTVCAALHDWANSLHLFHFPFEESAIPLNGIYLLFERGEMGHGSNRIVRVGTHTGKNQLRSRLKQHFLVENKDRSIFRKNIGRAILLNRDHDSFLSKLGYRSHFTSRKNQSLLSTSIVSAKLSSVYRNTSARIFRSSVIRLENKTDRLSIESKLISTLSHCEECGPSAGWLGAFHLRKKPAGAVFGLVNESQGATFH